MIEGGWSTEAIRFLSGAPTQTFPKNSNNFYCGAQVFRRMQAADSANHISLAQTAFSATGRFSNGLLSSTTYTVLSAHNIFSSMDLTTPRA